MYPASLRRAALIIAILSSFMTPFMGSSINLALPAIAKEFKIDAVILTWIPTAYLLASAVCLVPFGRLADLYGRKKIFGIGIIAFTLSSLLCAVAASVLQLILFRILQGIGSAMIFATGLAILTSVFPPHERGKVLGISVAAVYTGLSMGPVLGGLLTQYFTWRSVFLANLPFGIAILILVLWRLKEEWAEAKGEAFDLTGSIIYGIGLAGFICGLSLLPSMESLGLLIFGTAALCAFVKWEMRTKSPVFPVNLFKANRVFALSSLAAFINYSATFAITFLLSLYLQHIKGLTPRDAGLILIFQPVVMAACSPVAGWLSDKIEPRVVATAGMLLTTMGLVPFIFLNQGSSIPFLLTGLVILGIGFGLFSSPNTNAIMSSVDKRFYGLASGAVGTMRLLGMMISMGMATVVFALFIGRVEISETNYPALIKSIGILFSLFSLMCFAGIFASMVRGNTRLPR
ncbi:MAG: putative transport protein [Deltaproteobacteria bacterium]|nr:putative transport protein [Deltaproteobacteria bacterium]